MSYNIGRLLLFAIAIFGMSSAVVSIGLNILFGLQILIGG